MPSTANIQWDVKTTGNDNNGGGFDPSSSGTDYSQQNSAQVAFTDLVIGATNTQLTSALNPFTSAYVGNVINIVSGTNFNLQNFLVISVSSGVATMDRAVGTAGATGGHGNLGGCLATPGKGLANQFGGNVTWIQSGTYTLTTNMAQDSNLSGSLVGYATTHGDNGTPPLITTSTNSISIMTCLNGTLFATIMAIRNIKFSNTAATRGAGIVCGNASGQLWCENCSFTGFSDGIAARTGTAGTSIAGLYFINCQFSNCTNSAIVCTTTTAGGELRMSDCVVSGCTGDGLAIQMAFFIDRCLIVGNGGNGLTISPNGMGILSNSTIAGNTSNGFSSSAIGAPSFVTIKNNIFYGNGGYGVNTNQVLGQSSYIVFADYNAFGSNTSGTYHNISAGPHDVTLTATPFTNSGSGDYSLNATSAGGALCKGVGFPGAFPNGTTTGHLDIGAVQSAGSGGTSNFGSFY